MPLSEVFVLSIFSDSVLSDLILVRLSACSVCLLPQLKSQFEFVESEEFQDDMKSKYNEAGGESAPAVAVLALSSAMCSACCLVVFWPSTHTSSFTPVFFVADGDPLKFDEFYPLIKEEMRLHLSLSVSLSSVASPAFPKICRNSAGNRFRIS